MVLNDNPIMSVSGVMQYQKIFSQWGEVRPLTKETNEMMKPMMKVTAVAALVLAGANMPSAIAAQDATVNIIGSIAAVSCDIGANGNASTTQVAVGNFKPADFEAGTAAFTGFFVPKDAAAEKQFTVNLSNCTGTVADTGVLSLQLQGNTIGANTKIFNQNSAATAGAIVRYMGDAGTVTTNTMLGNGDKVAVKTYATAIAGDANGTVAYFGTTLAATSLNPTAQNITAPVTFSIAYN